MPARVVYWKIDTEEPWAQDWVVSSWNILSDTWLSIIAESHICTIQIGGYKRVISDWYMTEYYSWESACVVSVQYILRDARESYLIDTDWVL